LGRELVGLPGEPVSNVGDVTHDGYDDLSVSVPELSDISFYFFGGLSRPPKK